MFEVITSRIPAVTPAGFGPSAGRVNENIGRAVVKCVQENFLSLPSNARNFPSTGFWQRAAEATTYEIGPDGVRVVVDQVGVRQRLSGGPIVPVNGKFLTIPAIAAAYGHRVTDFAGLRVARVNGDWWGRSYPCLALVGADVNGGNNDQIDPESVYFWLARSVRQEPNPDVMPSDDEIGHAALDAILEALK